MGFSMVQTGCQHAGSSKGSPRGRATRPTSWATVACLGGVVAMVAADQLLFTVAESLEQVTGSAQLGSWAAAAGAAGGRAGGSDAWVVAGLVAVVCLAVWFAGPGALLEEPSCEPAAAPVFEAAEDHHEEPASGPAAEPCLRWNEGACKARPGSCRFSHFCNTCGVPSAKHRSGSRLCPRARVMK
mmetsp:Transcript_53493/g.117427  ORF Transcript_53493/g.117427 Transcript_53493/m.117427 type:complete len:185 (-) Transcript_53493:36-590(-)